MVSASLRTQVGRRQNVESPRTPARTSKMTFSTNTEAKVKGKSARRLFASTAEVELQKHSSTETAKQQFIRQLQRTARPRPPSPSSPTNTTEAGSDVDVSDELWNHIWSSVEGEFPKPKQPTSLAIEVYSETRRRLIGKQPPVFAIEVYRRRLHGKHSPQHHFVQQQIREATSKGVRGHYDVLGIHRTSSTAEVHAAYRRKVLATHPDKGGDADAFRQVVAAFQELADVSRRASYDRTLEMFGRMDGLTETSKPRGVASRRQECPKVGARAAQILYLRLLANDPSLWSSTLHGLSDAILEAMQMIILGTTTLSTDEEKGFEAPESKKVQNSSGPICITHHRNGYKVSVAWPSLTISTSFTKSLAQAIDWQLALLWLRALAEERLGKKAKPSAKSDLLTQDEVLRVLESEPTMAPLSFAVAVRVGGQKGKKISAGCTQDVLLALDIRRRFIAAAGSRCPEKSFKQEKQKADKDILHNRRQRKQLEKSFAEAVTKELKRRLDQVASGRKRKHSVEESPVIDRATAKRRLSIKDRH